MKPAGHPPDGRGTGSAVLPRGTASRCGALTAPASAQEPTVPGSVLREALGEDLLEKVPMDFETASALVEGLNQLDVELRALSAATDWPKRLSQFRGQVAPAA